MTSDSLILSIDQGTTSSRVMLFDRSFRQVFCEQRPLTLSYPHDGWVEQNPAEITADVIDLVKHAVRYAEQENRAIAYAGLTNQRETVIAWDRSTGCALYPAIVWQDRRTATYCAALTSTYDESQLQRKTGLFFDPYFSASKIRWLFDNVPEVSAKAHSGELMVGTIDSFVAFHLLENQPHITDATNASRTALMTLSSSEWNAELLELFELPEAILPKIVSNTGTFGTIKDTNISLVAMIGDQQSAALGQACVGSGDVKSTYGTGCFILANTGSDQPISKSRLVTTLAYQDRGERSFALEGSLFNAGSAVQWLRDGLGIIPTSPDIEALAKQSSPASTVMMVPAFTGLGAPDWLPDARASFFGISRDSTRADFAKATLEALAFQTRDLLLCLQEDGAFANAAQAIKVDGGMSENTLFVQLVADICERSILRPAERECTALGVAMLARCYMEKEPLSRLKQWWQIDRSWAPTLSASDLVVKAKRWSAAKKACSMYAKEAQVS